MGKYDNLSKEELLKLIKKQELDLKSKKYGLVWDDEKEPEQVVLDCRDNLPVLERIKGKEIKEPKDNTQEDNILIEGDNYHALTVLNYTHQEKIDVIYIDPPYNTGNKDFKYNDNYVDKEDGYRHSKWLNFMEKRLKLAKKLLKEDGVIFISIGKDELAQLILLVKDLFGENHYLDMLPREQKSGSNQGTYFSPQLDYIVVATKNKNRLSEFIQKSKNKKTAKSLYQSSLDSRPNQRYWIKCPDGSFIIPKGSIYPKVIEDGSKITPKNKNEKVWRWSVDSYKEDKRKPKSERKLFFKETNSGTLVDENLNPSKWNIYVKPNNLDDNTQTPRDYIFGFTNNKGSKILKDMDLLFNNPKPIELIEYLINITNKNKNITILDFMAGSGTTAQAVLELNKEDGGNRKFILCTNNENNICTEITYPRVEKVIKGYDFKGKDKTILFEKKLTWTDLNKKIDSILEEVNNLIENKKESYDKIEKEFKNNILKIIGIKNIKIKKEGLGGNLQYFKTSLIKTTKNRDQTKINLTQKCTEMLCLKENIFNVEIENEDFKIFSSNKKDKFLCVYYNFIEESFKEFLEEIKKLKGEKIVYMFSLEDKIDKSLFKEIKNCKLEAIPKKILEIYKKLVKMNIPIKAETIFIDLEKAKKQIFEDKDKDTGAKTLRVVLEKLVQKIAQKNQINILTDKGKEIKLSTLNDTLKSENVFTKVEWEENKTYLTIGNQASHGEYDEFDLTQVNKFYKHIQTLINKFNI